MARSCSSRRRVSTGFTASQIADRFDIGMMSTKGMSVTAARRLVDALAALGVRLFVLHDFDITGFSIKKTLTEIRAAAPSS